MRFKFTTNFFDDPMSRSRAALPFNWGGESYLFKKKEKKNWCEIHASLHTYPLEILAWPPARFWA